MDCSRFIVQVFVGALSPLYEALSIEASKHTTSEEIVACICERLKLQQPENYELAEVIGNAGGQECKERRLDSTEKPIAVQLLWPKTLPQKTTSSGNVGTGSAVGSAGMSAAEFQAPEYRFCLREKFSDSAGQTGKWLEGTDPQLIRDYFLRFLYQPKDKEYPDLCQLPDLNETSLLENLQARFHNGHIYTYVGSILIALNPFKFYPIYNPKYVNLYQNRRLGELPPHIFAVADAAYHTMLREKRNQCIVISGESGSGKTESTNLLLHHLTALSQKGTYGSGVEQTILSAGPVLEIVHVVTHQPMPKPTTTSLRQLGHEQSKQAFGNAKTAHNNNSSRFGKFIQVNYKENGMVHGAIVQKYLLEKSRIVSQAKKERNYHVFYYLLAGATEEERTSLRLLPPQEYHYLNQSACYTLEGVDESYEFVRLKQSMEMVGFSFEKQKRLFAVLSAVLLLGNIEFTKKSTYHHDEAVLVKNPELVTTISSLLKVKEETLMSALTTKKAKISGEILVINYRLPEAIAARDALAKCLYGALFDWIVLQVNHALLSKKDEKEHNGYSIGVLDIFGFEDFGIQNSFEQFCINFANEHLQYYFNQHVFKYEQEEYKREGIKWKIIDFKDNTGCLSLIEGKPNGLLCILDDQCNFPGATNETLLQKFHSEHKDTEFYEIPHRRDHGFVIKHYAGKVKYSVKDFREKNLDLMRQDIVSVLKNSTMVFVRELVGSDPVAVFRWAILRAFIQSYFAFIQAGKNHVLHGGKTAPKNQIYRLRKQNPSENIPYSSKSSNRKQNGSRRPFTDVHNNKVGDGKLTNEELDAKALKSNMQNLEGILGESESRVIQRATRIMQRKRNFQTHGRNCKSLKNLQSVKTLAGKTQGCSPGRTLRKQPPTVSAQFQNSLILLMETLNDASPFFVRCIKSNADKVPNKFDEDIVLRQLRYTGMLETVRIRQSGYNVRLSFDEFIHVYRILLPKGLVSSKTDVRDFLFTMNLNRDNYQIGTTKVFMRESEKLKLDLRLHQVILDRIVTIQRWYRVILERKAFLRLRAVILGIQSYARRYLSQKSFALLKEQWIAAIKIQACWRGYVKRKKYQQLRRGVIFIQGCFRGFLARTRFKELKEEQEKIKEKERLLEVHLKEHIDIPDSQFSQSDEAFVSKESSQEELENDRLYALDHLVVPKEHRDSEESSGIQEDSEAETMVQDLHRPQPLKPIILERSPPLSPKSGKNSISPTSPEIFICHKTSLHKPSEYNVSEDIPKKPIKKLSIKRSKSARAALGSDAVPPFVSKHKVEKQGSKGQSIPDLVKEQELVQRGRTDDLLANRNPFHRAKRHLKGAIEFLGKKNKSQLNDEESDESGCDDNTIIANHSPLDTPEQSPVDADSVLERFESSSLPNSNVYLQTATYPPPSPHYMLHNFKETNKFSKTEVCLACEKALAAIFQNHGYRCTECNLVAHHRCIQQASKWTCSPSSVALQRKARRPTITRIDVPSSGNWNVTRTMEYSDRTDQVISDVMELRNMDEFISRKICKMEVSSGKRDTIADVVFKKALKEFKAHLISTYSIAAQEGKICIKYRDLITSFENAMENVCKQEKSSATFPVTMGVNAFRGFINEFVSQQRTEEKPKAKTKKEKKKKNDPVMNHLGHTLVLVVVNIPTVCEICSSFIWLMEKILVCQKCKLTCHKKCCSKLNYPCKDDHDVSPQGGRVFGVRLQMLLVEDLKVPVVVDRLITTIEMKGLYTEGIYRKSGASTKVKQLRHEIENDVEKVDYDDYPVHVLCTVLKAFFREMPEPLLTYESYDEFIRATDISDYNEKVTTFFDIVNKLPRPNYNLVERLIFHLSRVAQQVESNLMSASSLAIVFAPCILRTNKCLNAQDSLNDISKQTMCIEYIIEEQLKKLKTTIADIDTIDMVCHKASSRLSSLRSNKMHPLEDNAQYHADEHADTGVEEVILSRQIESLRNEKTLLTTELPTLKRACSDDDMLSVEMVSSVSSADDVPHSQHEEYAVTFDLPVFPPSLNHLTKHRAGLPHRRRRPSKFVWTSNKPLLNGDLNGNTNSSIDCPDTSISSMYDSLDVSTYKDEAIMV